MNSRGGTLLIGVNDDGTVHGIAADIAVLERPDRGPRGRDAFLNAFANVVSEHLGGQAAALLRTQVIELDGQQLCIVNVDRSPEPVYLREAKDREEFYVRLGTSTRSLGMKDTAAYIKMHWG